MLLPDEPQLQHCGEALVGISKIDTRDLGGPAQPVTEGVGVHVERRRGLPDIASGRSLKASRALLGLQRRRAKGQATATKKRG